MRQQNAPIMEDLPPEKAARYACLNVDAAKVIASWKSSLFSFEWLMPDGTIKPAAALKEEDRVRRAAVEVSLQSGTPLPRPILGFGLNGNVEIGSGRHVFLTLYAAGYAQIPVLVGKADQDDFQKFV